MRMEDGVLEIWALGVRKWVVMYNFQGIVGYHHSHPIGMWSHQIRVKTIYTYQL
jgi:hypothetical protein